MCMYYIPELVVHIIHNIYNVDSTSNTSYKYTSKWINEKNECKEHMHFLLIE